MQKSKSTTSPVSHVHNVLGHLLRDFTRFPALIFNISFDTSAAAMVHSRRRQPMSHPCRTLGQDRDVQTAIRLAKRMIVDGRMPTPEEAEQQLKEQERRDRLGEPGSSCKTRSRSRGTKDDAYPY